MERLGVLDLVRPLEAQYWPSGLDRERAVSPGHASTSDSWCWSDGLQDGECRTVLRVFVAFYADPFGALAPNALLLLVAVGAEIGAGSKLVLGVGALGEPLRQADGERSPLWYHRHINSVGDRFQGNINIDDGLVVARNEAGQPFLGQQRLRRTFPTQFATVAKARVTGGIGRHFGIDVLDRGQRVLAVVPEVVAVDLVVGEIQTDVVRMVPASRLRPS